MLRYCYLDGGRCINESRSLENVQLVTSVSKRVTMTNTTVVECNKNADIQGRVKSAVKLKKRLPITIVKNFRRLARLLVCRINVGRQSRSGTATSLPLHVRRLKKGFFPEEASPCCVLLNPLRQPLLN